MTNLKKKDSVRSSLCEPGLSNQHVKLIKYTMNRLQIQGPYYRNDLGAMTILGRHWERRLTIDATLRMLRKNWPRRFMIRVEKDQYSQSVLSAVSIDSGSPVLTDDVSLQVFMDHLKKLAVSSSS